MRLYKRWHRPIAKRFIKLPYSISRAASIDSDCCRLPTTSVLSNKSEKHVPTSFDQQFQVSQGYTSYKNKENWNIEVHGGGPWTVEAGARASIQPSQSPVHPWKSPTNLARSPLHVALVGRKMTVVRDQLFPQKPPGSRFRFSRTGVQPSPGSSTIELPSAFAESGMVTNVSVQYSGGFLPEIILLTLCKYTVPCRVLALTANNVPT